MGSKKEIKVNVANKKGFDEVWSILKTYDQKCGIYLFRGDSQLTKMEKLHHKKWLINIFVVLFLMVSTLIVKNFNLFIIILVTSCIQMIFTIHYTVAICVQRKELITQIFKWVASVSEPNMTYFHPVIRKMARNKLEQQHRFTSKCVKFIGSSFQASFAFTFLAVLLPEKIHPKFSPPLPFFLPFEEQDNWVSFGVTMLIQTFMANGLISFITLTASIFICLVLYLLLMLDIIKESIKMFGNELQMQNQVQPKLDESSTSNEIKLTTLFEIDAQTKLEAISLVQWLQIITDMLSDVNQKVNFLNELFSGVFLFIEIASFCSLMIFGLIFSIWKQQRIFGFALNAFSVILFGFCSINERMLERYEEIEMAFYNIPWYQLPPKDRKLLLIAMNCNKIQRGFTAMGIHQMTTERLKKIVNAAYKNCLILRDLFES